MPAPALIVPDSDALIEARKPLRLDVLRRLIELQAVTNAKKLISLAQIMNNPELSKSQLRDALRGLHSVGLIKSGGSGYRVTPMGRHLYTVLHRHP
jgi:hypothetical protein